MEAAERRERRRKLAFLCVFLTCLCTVLYFTFLFWGVHHLDLSGVPSWPVQAGVVGAANELKVARRRFTHMGQ